MVQSQTCKTQKIIIIVLFLNLYKLIQCDKSTFIYYINSLINNYKTDVGNKWEIPNYLAANEIILKYMLLYIRFMCY